MCSRCYSEMFLQFFAGAGAVGGALWMTRQWLMMAFHSLRVRASKLFNRHATLESAQDAV